MVHPALGSDELSLILGSDELSLILNQVLLPEIHAASCEAQAEIAKIAEMKADPRGERRGDLNHRCRLLREEDAHFCHGRDVCHGDSAVPIYPEVRELFPYWRGKSLAQCIMDYEHSMEVASLNNYYFDDEVDNEEDDEISMRDPFLDERHNHWYERHKARMAVVAERQRVLLGLRSVSHTMRQAAEMELRRSHSGAARRLSKISAALRSHARLERHCPDPEVLVLPMGTALTPRSVDELLREEDLWRRFPPYRGSQSWGVLPARLQRVLSVQGRRLRLHRWLANGLTRWRSLSAAVADADVRAIVERFVSHEYSRPSNPFGMVTDALLVFEHGMRMLSDPECNHHRQALLARYKPVWEARRRVDELGICSPYSFYDARDPLCREFVELEWACCEKRNAAAALWLTDGVAQKPWAADAFVGMPKQRSAWPRGKRNYDSNGFERPPPWYPRIPGALHRAVQGLIDNLRALAPPLPASRSQPSPVGGEHEPAPAQPEWVAQRDWCKERHALKRDFDARAKRRELTLRERERERRARARARARAVRHTRGSTRARMPAD